MTKFEQTIGAVIALASQQRNDLSIARLAGSLALPNYDTAGACVSSKLLQRIHGMRQHACSFATLGLWLLASVLPITPLAAQNSDSRGVGVQVASPDAIPDARHNWGVFIGINDFKARGVPALKYCVTDAYALRDVLTGGNALIPAAQSYLLASDRAGNDSPDKLNILKAVKYACDNAGADSLIIISIATHGFTGTDGKSYILPADGDPDLLADTAISVERINELLARSKATKKLLIVDACRERTGLEVRGLGDVRMSDAFVRALKTAAGQVTLAACGSGEMAHEDAEAQHGVFTRYLVEGLNGAAARNAEGFISVYTLSQYAVKKTREWCSANRRPAQTPWLAGEMSFDIPLALPGRLNELPLAPVAPVTPVSAAPTVVPLFGALRVTTPKAVEISLDGGAPIRAEPDKALRWEKLTVGRHKVHVTANSNDFAGVAERYPIALAANGKEFDYAVDIQEGIETTFKIRFQTSEPSESGYGHKPERGYEYKLVAGDTLLIIAKAYRDQGVKVTADQILKANPGLDPKNLKAGQKIFIPAPAQ